MTQAQSDTEHTKSTTEDTDLTELIDIIEQDIRNIANIRRKVEEETSKHQKLIESITYILGQPRTLYLLFAFSLAWITYNIGAQFLGVPQIDIPPFFYLQGMVGLIALFTTTSVLIKQNRQDKISEQRAHLELELSLLVERKTSKIIELLEKLRRDTPTIGNHDDIEAKILKESADPARVIRSLQHTFNQALEGDDKKQTQQR